MNAIYILEGSDSDLKEHTGHLVEVTGIIDSTGGGHSGPATSSPSTGSTTRGSTGSTTGSAGVAAGAPPATGATTTDAAAANDAHMAASAATRLRVSSIRMISADCSAPGK